MIGLAGIYSFLDLGGDDFLQKIKPLHDGYDIPFQYKTYGDPRFFCTVVARDEIYEAERENLYYEDDDCICILEGVVPMADKGVVFLRKLADALRDNPEAVCSLCGEFVAVVYEKESARLHIVNDRFASRPLYYMTDGSRFVFSSELKSIQALAGRSLVLSDDGLMEFLAFSHNIGVNTMFEGVQVLPPASILTADAGTVKVASYWALRFNVVRGSGSADFLEDAAAKLRVGARKRFLGRPKLGMGLSGGLDSRLVAAVVPEECYPVFTRTYGDRDSLQVKAATEIAARLGLHHYVHEPKEIALYSYLFPSVWRTECRVHFTGLKSIIEHRRLKDKQLYNLSGHFGDVLTGKQLRPFMFFPASRPEFIDKVFAHYTWYTYRHTEILRRVIRPDRFDRLYEALRERFAQSFASIDQERNWDAYDVWDLTNRQPRFTFNSCAVDNYLFSKITPFVDYEYVDAMLSVPGWKRFGQSAYKGMIARFFPEVGSVVNSNSGKRIKRGILTNYWDLGNQYLASRRGRRYESDRPGGKADLFRRDSDIKHFLEEFARGDLFPDSVLSREGVLAVIAEHYETSRDHSYLLGVLSTFAACQVLFAGNGQLAMQERAKPW